MITVSEISKSLARNAEHIAKMLLPEGKRQGREWIVGGVHGERGKSMAVCVSGDKAGIWSDFATGESGDLLDLWRESKGIDFKQAVDEAKEYLGIHDHNPRFESHKEKVFRKPQKPKCSSPKSQALDYLHSRGFEDRTIQAFKVAADNGNIYFPFMRNDELIMCKYRSIVDKKTAPTSADQEPCLFGWQALDPNSRTVAICEGEFDAMALHQMGVQALSVPFGGGKGAKQQWIEYEYNNLKHFETIYVCMDNDQAGKEGAAEIIARLGRHRCRLVSLPAKDANDCLKEGIPSEYVRQCFERSVTLDPEELKQASQFVDEVIAEFYPEDQPERPGFYGPWQHTHSQFRFSMSELSIFNGVNGHGKSQMVGHLMLEALRSGESVCIASMELKPAKLLKRLVSQASGMRDGKPTKEYIQAITQWFHDRLYIFNVVGTTKKEKLLEVFEYARQRYGVRVFVVDSLLKCGIGDDDYNGQKLFVERLCDFKNDTDSHLMLVTHSRKGESELKPTGKMDVKGSGSITDLADMVFTTWRNKIKERDAQAGPKEDEDPDIFDEKLKASPDAILYCDKNRNGDWEGTVNLWFCRNSFQYLSGPDQKPFQYVNYNKNNVVNFS